MKLLPTIATAAFTSALIAIPASNAAPSKPASGGLAACINKVETVRYEPVRLADGNLGRVMVVVPSETPVPAGVHLVVLYNRGCVND